MCAKPDQPDPHDRAIDRLIAGALQPSAAPAAAGISACPDAELMAAYADQGLSDSDRIKLEGHFADCERCQQALSMLGAALEAPAGAAESAMPAPVAAPVAERPAPSVQRWLWWLSPAFGAAAAALLWMVLRPAAPQPVQTAANFPATNEQETRALNAPLPSTLLPQPAESPMAAGRDAMVVDRLAKAEPESKEAAVTTTRQGESGQVTLPSAMGAVTAATAPSARSDMAASTATTAAAAQTMVGQVSQADQLPSAPIAPAQNQVATPSPPPVRDEANQQQAPVQSRATAAFGAVGSPQVSTQRLETAAETLAQLSVYTFAPPGGGAIWRLGLGGGIQRSTDQGKTWVTQSSGVTADLIAGSAASKDVAWVVGRNGVILRTTDGERWERIMGPAGVTSEWAAVAAHDDMTATVVADDLRRYSTQDGGRTWTLQQ